MCSEKSIHFSPCPSPTMLSPVAGLDYEKILLPPYESTAAQTGVRQPLPTQQSFDYLLMYLWMCACRYIQPGGHF